MNFLHHRQQTRCHVLPLPEGLQELMSDISREVLRCQPTIDCTYKFIADYLDAMIMTRDKSRIAMEIIEDAILKTDEIYQQFVKCSIPKDKTNSFLDIMELTFRRFVEQKRRLKQDPRFITFHADDMLEELVRKCDLTKTEILRSRPAIQWAYKKFVRTYLAAIEGTLDTADLYLNTDKLVVSCKEYKQLHESAIKIQKVYRGYYVRKSLPKRQEQDESSSSTTEEEGANKKSASAYTDLGSFEKFAAENEEEISRAAIKIQSTYKGFTERKKLKHKREVLKVVNDLTQSVEFDEDLAKAAITIQASYKGYKVRKGMQDSRTGND